MDYALRMAKGFAPAAERNRGPILDVLRRVLPVRGTVLEIASGTGQHAVFFSERLTELRWLPSDASPDALRSIASWVKEEARDNLLTPVELDVRWQTWPVTKADAMLCINMIHISPWESSEALFAGAQRILDGGAPMVTYGPYRVGGEHTAQSNAAFDESLRARDPRWGVRDIDDLEALAKRTGFSLEERVAMPANNMTLVWRRRPQRAAATKVGCQNSITK
jgi:SAM-dependent methyltransferase